MLKDSLSLARKVNQTFNQFRRNLVKTTSPKQFMKLAVIRMILWIFYRGKSRISKIPTKYPTERLKVNKENKVPGANIKLQVLFKVPE